jgi:uncharacterized membrane protein
MFFGGAGIVLGGLIFYQEVWVYPRLRLVYEEEPESVLVSLVSPE